MRRLLTLVASVLIAAASIPVLAGTATAAPARGNTKDNPVILIHGFNITANTDCSSTWATTENHLRNNGWTGELVTYGYYADDTNCDVRHEGNLDTPITVIAEHLAWHIYRNYSSTGQKVDVVAYSMGGLIIRTALLRVQLQHGMERPPPYLYVEDVVTLATPHKGSLFGGACDGVFHYGQCQDMAPGSGMIQYLESLGTGWDGHPRLPESAMGTDWTVMSSSEDVIASQGSGSGVAADHKIQYNSLQCTGDAPGLTHDNWPYKATGSYCVRVRHAPGSWSTWAIRNPSAPVARAYLGVYRETAG